MVDSLEHKVQGRMWTCSIWPVPVSPLAMEFHENLHDMAVKEGLKGRKLHKAVESFTWNITILKVRGTAHADKS